MEKKNAQPRNAELSAIKNSAKCITLSPREARTLVALVHAKDWLAREAIDRIACSSNGPAVVQALRCKLGNHDAIEMQCVPVLDADGKTAQAGRYRLSETHRARAVALLGVVTMRSWLSIIPPDLLVVAVAVALLGIAHMLEMLS